MKEETLKMDSDECVFLPSFSV